MRWSAVIARVAIAGIAVAAATGFAAPAAAQPATSVAFGPGATATLYAGQAFDACTAPPLATMTAWQASPYRAVGVYIGGVNRSCGQPELTAAWVTSVSSLGWRLVPIYKGLQAPCGGKPTDQKISPASAVAQGRADGSDAVAAATALGMLSGSALYNDMEYYTPGKAACRDAVLAYLSGWVTQVHQLGYLAGIYAQLNSGAFDLAGAYTSASYARPDALWVARYDLSPALTGWAGIPGADWTMHQRAKQYRGGHDETYGKVRLNIDNDQFDGPVASVGYQYSVTSGTPLSARTGPATSYPATGSYPPGAPLAVACQTPGQQVGATSVWDKLTDGTYVTDLYVSTSSSSAYTAPLPRCSYPYQVTAAGGLSARTGPGTSFPATGIVPNGALAWLTCQRSGSLLGTSRVWDRLRNGRWLADFHIATPGSTTFSPPAPRC